MTHFIIAFIIAAIVFSVGLIGLIKKVRLSRKATSIIRFIFLLNCAILVLAVILAQSGIYYRGYWTTRVLIWIFICLGSLLFSFGDRKIITTFWQIATSVIYGFPVVSALTLVIPSVATFFAVFAWGQILGDPAAILYSDNEMRIEQGFQAPFSPAAPISYIKKRGILEYDNGSLPIEPYNMSHNLKISKSADSITLYLNKDNGIYIVDTIPVTFKR